MSAYLTSHSTIRQKQHIDSISYSFATTEPQSFFGTEETFGSEFQVNDTRLYMLFFLSLLIIPVLVFVTTIWLKRRKHRKLALKAIDIGRQHAGVYFNTTTQTGHSDTLLMSTMNSINDTNLSSSETDFELIESTFTGNNIYESIENVIKQNDSDQCFDDSGYLAPVSKT